MFDYEKLWKLLKKRGLKKVDLKKMIGITPTTLAKLNKNENVSMEVLNRLCEYLECDIGDIVEHVYTPYKLDATLGTFKPNKNDSIYGWYSYLEGYSKKLVETELDKLGEIDAVLDPFGGSGTTPLVGIQRNLKSYYCETNPVMAFICNVKTSVSFKISQNKNKMKIFYKEIEDLEVYLEKLVMSDNYSSDMQGFEKYFELENVFFIEKYKEYINNIEDEDILAMFKVALASIAVSISKMIRRGDLRYAKGKEVNKTNNNFTKEILDKLRVMYTDLEILDIPSGKSIFLTPDARDIKEENIIDVVITSPPYLNGTNYIRNTKLELKLLDYVNFEKELSIMHRKGIVAGINNVCNFDKNKKINIYIKDIIESLNKVSYDSRIQKMVISYFNDMEDVFIALKKALKDGGRLIMDIGDSQFAGVHIPTHEILINIAEKYGFIIYENEVIRSRKSKSGFELTQRILRFNFKKNINENTNKEIEDYRKKAIEFLKNKSYQSKGRNWGHQWHSLCSYRGKLKPAIASELVETFSNPGERVLDPMSGVGTIPLEACLQGRIGIANDLSELAYIVSTAKVKKPLYNDVVKAMKSLDNYIELNKNKFEDNQEVKSFGLNKTISEYFHPETMKEILAAREYFMKKKLSVTDCFIMSCLMHILHGNRPYALSRTSHPLTPYAPKGEFVYKKVINNLYDKILRSYKNLELTELWTTGESYNYDILELCNVISRECDIIITSPPFSSSFKFYTQNWMRLWFSGWSSDDFKKADNKFFDNKQNRNMDIYYSYFEVCSKLLKNNGKMILHVGKSEKFDMAKELIERSKQWFELVESGNESIIGENHGIVDIGATTAHQYIFLIKK